MGTPGGAAAASGGWPPGASPATATPVTGGTVQPSPKMQPPVAPPPQLAGAAAGAGVSTASEYLNAFNIHKRLEDPVLDFPGNISISCKFWENAYLIHFFLTIFFYFIFGRITMNGVFFCYARTHTTTTTNKQTN